MGGKKEEKTMNVERLRMVRDMILEEPKRLDMNVLGVQASHWVNPDESPRCGTVGCIGGWSALLALGEGKWESLSPEEREGYMSWWRGQEALGLTVAEARRLFREPKQTVRHMRDGDEKPDGGWPLELAEEYMMAGTKEEKARITARRIDLFIETGGQK